MPEEPDAQSPETPPPYGPGRRVGTGLAGETTRGEGSTILPSASQRPLEVIGDFEVIGKLGQGGMGAVYRARQISLDRQVALKLLPPNFEADADYVARFQREARLAASLSHPNLVKVYSAGVAGGSHYIAMELVEGETLGQWVKRGALPPLEALRITLDVARALECGWRTAHLIHRDIKPGNIFLSEHGDVKLGDLGLAKIIGGESTSGLTQTGAAMGTPHYISPEQARGDKDLDVRADIYSLGCTLYQMLTKQTPYSGRDPVVVINQHINAPPPAILKVMPECPLPLARLVSKMLKKQRRERQASYEELIAQIESVRAQLDPSLTAPTVPAPSAPDPVLPVRTGASAESSPPAPAKSRMAVYGGAGVLALAVAAFFLWPRPEKLTKAERYARDHATQLEAAKEAAEAEEATKAALGAATKDAPFVNTLGMKFVPVPGTKALFSIWDTRVQDYAVFAAANPKADGAWRTQQKDGVPAGRELNHPVVGVSWEDAQAFCQWLTEKEQAEGKLPKGLNYRLPTDEEWSWAVGMPPELGSTPAEKDEKNSVDFPWGKDYPPTKKVGNYADETFHAKFPPNENEKVDRNKNHWIKGYTDAYATTSPVGAFPANAYGLYDMGGNVWQWCEDWYDASHKGRVFRGASWAYSARGPLLSSHRHPDVPTYRYDGDGGFRCVLSATAPAIAAKAIAIEPGAIKLWDAPDKIPQDPHLRWEDNAVRIDGGVLRYDGSRSRDAILRARIRMNPDANSPQLNLRHAGSSEKYNYYSLGVQPGEKIIQLRTVIDGRFQTLKDWPLPRAYGPDEWAQFELRAIGNELSVLLDGQLLGTVHDTSHPGPGGIQIYATAAGYFRDIVYVPLDGTAAASPAATPVAEPWQDVLHDPAMLVLSGGVERTAEGLRFTGASGAWLPRGPQGDGAIRVRANFGGLRVRLLARNRETVGAYSLYAKDEKMIVLGRWDQVAGEHRILREFSLPEPLKPGQDYTLELRVVGQTLTAKLNGEILGTVTDGTFPRGSFQVNVQEHDASPTLVKSLEVLDLGAPGASTPAPAAASTFGSYPQPAKWTDATADVRQRFLGKSLEADGEWLRASVPVIVNSVMPGQTFRNCVLRVVFSDKAELLLRRNQKKGDDRYEAAIDQTGAHIAKVISLHNIITPRTKLPTPLGNGVEHEAVFVAQGDELSLWLDGKQIANAHDTSLDSGTLAIELTKDSQYGDGRIKKIEYGELPDAPPPGTSSAANPASATRDAPFVNTLGMKFVPVPGTSSPQGTGQPLVPGAATSVLFSIWDTRVQDYAAYAGAKKVDGSWTTQSKDSLAIGRELNHPVVAVSWEDAQGFCQWLTEKEIAEGKLPKGMKYRLPTDEEWSWAVGLAPELGTTPAEKNGKNRADFPWGKEYPPRQKAGNYADEMFHATFPPKEYAKDDWSKNPWMEGYTDGYATTSPVGSFPANGYGLYDMGGNVWQWCEDWFDASHKERVLRGASWIDYNRGNLLSSHRGYQIPTSRYGDGFRCVLEPER